MEGKMPNSRALMTWPEPCGRGDGSETSVRRVREARKPQPFEMLTLSPFSSLSCVTVCVQDSFTALCPVTGIKIESFVNGTIISSDDDSEIGSQALPLPSPSLSF